MGAKRFETTWRFHLQCFKCTCDIIHGQACDGMATHVKSTDASILKLSNVSLQRDFHVSTAIHLEGEGKILCKLPPGRC